MPRRQRDHKAEYARRKARARAAGYTSVKAYSRARKELGTPRNASPIPRRVYDREQTGTDNIVRLRREAAAWSDKHSATASSRYRPDMTDDQVANYHAAFVERITEGSRRGRARERRRRIRDYLVPDWISESEWDQKYGPV